MTSDIRVAMNATARAAWSAVADGDDFGVRLREDTVTEGALLHLARRFPLLILQKFNQADEKSSGGDWEWFVGSRRHGWIAFRIQAKRMDGLRYRQLDHGGQLPGERQYDTLLRDSAAASVPTFPFHVFFNGWSSGWPRGFAWNACPNGTTFPRCAHHDMSDMGCSLLPATTVRDLHRSSGRKRLRVATYLPTSVPWSWLFGPPPKRTSSGPGPTGWPAGIGGLSQLLAWHETMAATLAEPPPSGVNQGGSTRDHSPAEVLLRRWAELLGQGAVIPEGRPAERLPAYADWTLKHNLRERLLRDRLDGLATDAWDFLESDDDALRDQDQQTFGTPSTLSGLIFTPWPDA